MLNILTNEDLGAVANAKALLEGHLKFLTNNTGITYDAQVQHFVQNPEGVLANNRHFILATREEGQPNGDGTTEGQSLHILGHCYAYMATGNKEFLDKAEWHWGAYRQYFYAGQPVPTNPQRWICNWICNSKEPVLANFPINRKAPTQGGYKCVPLRFVNGEAQIPHGAPFWGEYTDVVTMAHRGHMAWPAINGGLRSIKNNIDWERVYNEFRVTTMPTDPTDPLAWVRWEDYLGHNEYTPDWSNEIKGIEKEWVNVWTLNTIKDGDIINKEPIPLADVGKFKVKQNINGVYLVNYAVRLPIDKGGYLFQRNEVWHNRPINTPLLGGIQQMGNAADGEEWFMDATYLLWVLTDKPIYRQALGSVAFTNHEYTEIDSKDRFFRQSTSSSTPFTDGISYDYTFPGGVDVRYSRDPDGYILADTDEETNLTLEQQAIWFRVSQASKVRNTYGGTSLGGSPMTAKIELKISPNKDPLNAITYAYTLPTSSDNTMKIVDIPVGKLTKLAKDNGDPYIVADVRAVSKYGGASYSEALETDVLGDRDANVVTVQYPNDDAGLVVGNWLLPSRRAPIQSITYKADAEFDLRIEDDNGWRWYWVLPATGASWVTKQLLPGNLILSGYQPNHPGEPAPSGPSYSTVDEFQILLENSSDIDKTFKYAYVNDVPPLYTDADGYVMLYRITVGVKGSGLRSRFGDCTILDYRKDNLAYTPGVIPFSNTYEEGTEQIGAWHGMPYPGYQYPFIYTLEPETYSTHLNNMVEFLYDSQLAYQRVIGELGPTAPAYIWNRWDNLKYGKPDTFSMYHWGDSTAWSGYEPRAFQGACRAWEELKFRNKPVPPKLITYVENWVRWLIRYVDRYKMAPTDFPPDRPSKPLVNDFTGHMSGLWITGLCQAHFAGCRIDGMDRCIEALVREVRNEYIVTDIPGQPMNGSWSPDPRTYRDNGMFFGFWAGELMRGLGMYVMYKTKDPSQPYYRILEY